MGVPQEQHGTRTIVLSHFQVKPILLMRSQGEKTCLLSIDLGLEDTEVTLTPDFLRLSQFPAFPNLTWREVEQIAKAENSCFAFDVNGLRKIQIFSDATNRPLSLYPTSRAPTMLVGGIPMHRVKHTDPCADTLAKVQTVAPLRGRVLDTCMGMGYTALQAATQSAAEHVVTIEHDPAVVEIARMNPWSRELFDNPRIERIIGDSYDIVPTFQPSTFNIILHDPPMFSLAGDLYSEEFYRELYRVLARDGKIFHYIGDLESKSGRNVLRGVIERMQAVGFRRIVKKREAFGVVAQK